MHQQRRIAQMAAPGYLLAPLLMLVVTGHAHLEHAALY
jgi:hypothetical protein